MPKYALMASLLGKFIRDRPFEKNLVFEWLHLKVYLENVSGKIFLEEFSMIIAM